MKKQQSDKYGMYSLLKKSLTTAPSDIIAEMPGAADLIVQFCSAFADLEKHNGVQIIKTKGHTEKKAELRISMIRQMLAVCNCVKGYAMNNRNIILFSEMDRTHKFFINSSAFACSNVCRALYKKTVPLLSELQPYGITALILEELDNTIKAFIKYIPQPRLQITNRKVATKGIASMVMRCEEILSQLDVLVTMLETRRPAFFQTYFSDRKTIDSGARALSIRGSVIDVAGNGIANVTIFVEGNKRVRKTSSKGNFQMKHLGDGLIQLTFKKSGYVDLVITVPVVKGERTDIKVTMEKLNLETGF